MRPRLLDLFCCGGGAARGYQRAEWHVTGVDIEPQPHYCGDEFYQADALTFPVGGFDAIHASPPCQFASRMNHVHKASHPNLIPPTRDWLLKSGLPWVIENVPEAAAKGPMRVDLLLCGFMFPELAVVRHRVFECGGWRPPLILHVDHSLAFQTPTGHGDPNRRRRLHRGSPTLAEWKKAMGIDWLPRDRLTQAIPPAYTEWIGAQLLAAMKAAT